MWRLIFLLSLSTVLFPMSRGVLHKELEIVEAIGVRTLIYEDEVRSRPVVVEFWYPTEKCEGRGDEPSDLVWVHPEQVRDASIAKKTTRYPLIVMSHGHRGDRRERSWLADVLVRHGYMVASVEHYGNTWYHYNPLISLRFWERAKDVSFALDRIFEDPELSQKIDPKRIGFVGYSLGGMTGLALAGAQAKITKEMVSRQAEKLAGLSPDVMERLDLSEAEQSYREPRIRSMLLLCPATFVYSPEALHQVKIPVALVAAVEDEVLPHHEHAYQIIQHLVPYRVKLMKTGVSHYSFLNAVTESGKKMLKKAMKSDALFTERASIHREVGDFAVEFFRETLR